MFYTNLDVCSRDFQTAQGSQLFQTSGFLDRMGIFRCKLKVNLPLSASLKMLFLTFPIDKLFEIWTQISEESSVLPDLGVSLCKRWLTNEGNSNKDSLKTDHSDLSNGLSLAVYWTGILFSVLLFYAELIKLFVLNDFVWWLLIQSKKFALLWRTLLPLTYVRCRCC